MSIFSCGGQLQYGRFAPGTGGCLVRFPQIPDRVLLMTAGHVVLPAFAARGDAIVDVVSGEMLGRLFSWTTIDGNPTADAALIWVDPAKVSADILGLGAPKGVNLQPVTEQEVMIAPHAGQTQPRRARIRALAEDVDVIVGGPGWPDAPTITYHRQIVTHTVMSEGGDSGSLVVDSEMRAVGMVVASSAATGTVITPITAILANAHWGNLQLEVLSSIPAEAVAPPDPGVPSAHAAAAQKNAAAPAATDDAIEAPQSPEAFVALIAKYAQGTMQQFGVPASFTIAQAALESGWGKSGLARNGRNLFGIKADKSWVGSVITMPTRERINGEWINEEARFRSYPTWQGSMDDHAHFFIDNPRYKHCFDEVDGQGWARSVAAAGYATDPDYANKVIATMTARNLMQYDTF